MLFYTTALLFNTLISAIFTPTSGNLHSVCDSFGLNLFEFGAFCVPIHSVICSPGVHKQNADLPANILQKKHPLPTSNVNEKTTNPRRGFSMTKSFIFVEKIRFGIKKSIHG
jgi:hypothetical protein